MVTAEIDGRPIDYYELMGMFYVLYVGGLDTVYSTIGWIMHHIATHPDLQQRLRADPSLLPQAIEEFCRAFSVVVTHRQVAKDFVFHGVPMKKGDEVNLPIMLANRDPAVSREPACRRHRPQAAPHHFRHRHAQLPGPAPGQARDAHRSGGIPRDLPEYPPEARRKATSPYWPHIRVRLPAAGAGLILGWPSRAVCMDKGGDKGCLKVTNN